MQSGGEIWGRSDPVGLGDLGEDLRRLLGSRLRDQPARGLREQSPREEEEDERRNRDNLDQSPGGDQPAWETKLSGESDVSKLILTNKREGNLTKRPSEAGITDDITPGSNMLHLSECFPPVLDVTDLTEDVQR